MSEGLESLQLRELTSSTGPTLVYLPGLHGDWTLAAGFRLALRNRLRFIEVTYPRSLTWSIADYASAIESALLTRGINHAWLLAESWGSQVAWELARRILDASPSAQPVFKPDGIILAGGFVKHPWKWGPGLLRKIGETTPSAKYNAELRIYAAYARWRHGNSPEILASMNEFIERRTELDRAAMRARLTLLEDYDPRRIARALHVPVHYLAGTVDPLVPWLLVRLWLRRRCPGYRGGKTFWLADHNVLASASKATADTVTRWINDGQASSTHKQFGRKKSSPMNPSEALDQMRSPH